MKVKQLQDVLSELASKLAKDGKSEDAKGVAHFSKLLSAEADRTVATFAKNLKLRGSSLGT